MELYEVKARELRKRLHECPEASMCEKKTKAVLMEFLRTETDLELVDNGNWFYAACRCAGAESSVAFRADYDAVTGEDGVSRHLCGHDGHAAVLAAFGLWLSKNRPGKNIYLIFQPGEESGEGALVCRRIFEKEKIDEIYGCHNIPGFPLGSILIKRGTFACASVGLAIKLTGAPAHAAYPEYGMNPALAMAELMIKMAEKVQEPHRGIVLSTVIGLEMGSSHFGVSVSEGTLRCTARAEYTEEFQELLSYITDTVKDTAGRYGLKYEITRHEEFPATENFDVCLDKLEQAAENKKMEKINMETPFRWSEDFGWYLEKNRGAFVGIGAGEDWPQLHTGEYEFPDGLIPYALKLYQGLIEK